MTEGLEILIQEFDAVLRDAQAMTFLPRSLQLQRGASEQLTAFLDRVRREKQRYRDAGDEVGANTALALELSGRAVSSELDMWIALKMDQPETAWNHLVEAQVAAEAAFHLRTSQLGDGGSHERLENYVNKLHLIETLVFPPQIYASVGGVVRRRECSICHDSYEACSHIKGRAYMGEVCYTIIGNVELAEISIVTDPADKRCRLTQFSDGGKMRNRMTWELEDRRESPPTSGSDDSRLPSN